MNKRMDLPKMPWTIRMAIGLLDALCVVVVIFALEDCGSGMRLFLMKLIGAVWFIGLDIELRRGWCAIRQLVTLAAIASTLLLMNPCWRALLCIALIVGTAIMLYIPPSSDWLLVAARIEKSELVGLWRKIRRTIYRIVLATPVVAVSLVGLIALPEIPGTWKYERLCAYPNREALQTAEPEEVSKVIEFSQNGTNYTAVVLSRIGFLPSGPAVFIYDESGIRVDQCSDSGDNDSFLRRWHCASW